MLLQKIFSTFLVSFTLLLSLAGCDSSAENDHCSLDGACSETDLNNKYKADLLVITVATERTEGYERFEASIHREGLQLETLGMNEEWKGGDVLRLPGGGHKVNLLKEAMEKYKERSDLVVMFVDSYDVVVVGGAEKILSRFFEFNAGAVFSAEGFCWPDASLSDQYPQSEGKKYLNSGGFIGYAPEIYKIVTHSLIEDSDDDQLFYTKIYLNPEMRDSLNIRLDSRAQIFQNLNGAVGDVNLTDDGEYPRVRNNAYGTYPIVLHGNGPSKVALNSLANYVAGAWKNNVGCLVCGDRRELSEDDQQLPKVTVGIFVERVTPFFPEFLEKFLALDYPKSRMSLFIHRDGDWHNEELREFLSNEVKEYAKVEVKSSDDLIEWKARNTALQYCLDNECEYYLNLDAQAHLTNKKVLRHLIAKDRSFIAPLILRYGQAWSNFWGALSSEGYYARSHDYMEIIKNEKRGIWNVPFVNQVYLVKASVLKLKDPPSYVNGALDVDMAFCKNLRDRGIFMWVDNLEEFGYLINPEKFDSTKTHPELHEIYENQPAWEERYIHKQYPNIFRNDSEVLLQPCPDVYWFPIVSPTFCRHLIETMEAFGEWSSGQNTDPRLAGGYENVPTRDIHMKQVGLERQWLYFLREYVRPVQEYVFTGYFHDPPKAIMNFVVRYRPNEQDSLRPHHDASTYTINIALNQVGVDFEGGGSRFIRQNCSVTSSPSGWGLLHPGRLTHYHEGLRTTNGTRYIMVSFVDP